jgi:hypothetical protein
MSISDRECLEFVFSIVDGLKVDRKKVTLDNLVEGCCEYIDAKRVGCKEWQVSILNAMHMCLFDLKNRRALEERLNAIRTHADTHPEKGALIADLARRALTGELREDIEIVGIKDFSIQMERLYNGDLTSDGVWRQAWERVNRRLKVVNSEKS